MVDYCIERLLETDDGGEECLDKALAQPACQIIEVPLEVRPLSFLDLPLPIRRLSVTFHCLSTAFRRSA